MKANWKTTTTGVITIVVAVCAAVKALIDNDPSTVMDVGTTIAAITAGVGLILAKDAEKTS